MRRARQILIAAIVVASLACGCAMQRGAGGRGSSSVAGPATSRPHVEPSALLTLDQVPSKPVLAEMPPATAPTSQPSLDAIQLYARARDAQLQNQRYTAINLLEKAIKLDPNSFELNYELGRVYLGGGGFSEQGLAAFERAAQIEPNDIEVQTELGRAYQSQGDLNKAIEHFRLALQTDEYHNDDPLAAVVDYRLAVALQQKGYDRAALQCYDSLLDRLEHPGVDTRSTPEINYLLARPQLLYEEIGKLYEKLGDYEEALKAYQEVAEASPNDFDPQARVVQTLLNMREERDARTAAADLVRRFHANAESIALLRQVYKQVGSESAFADALARLQREHPADRAILFVLADTLAQSGRLDDARNLLLGAIDSRDNDVEVVQRLYDLYAQRDQVSDAARLIIRVTAAHPDTTAELGPSFMDLLRLSRKNSLRLPALEKIDVPVAERAAKAYWVWRVATAWTRPATAATALDQSAHAARPFDPACRALLDSYLNRSEWDSAAKAQACDALIDSVKSRGRPDLAAELRGLVSLRADRAQDAVASFGQAVKLCAPSDPSPDLQLECALAHLKSGNSPRFEQLMWKLISDRPRFEAAYQVLLSYFKQNDAPTKAWNLVNTWLSADPNSVSARIQQAAELIEQRRGSEALSLIRKLFDQRPDDSDVVSALLIIHNAAGQSQSAIDLLEAERTRNPGNRVAVEGLVDMYVSQKRLAEASRVLDAARAAVADDPDLLYYMAHLYQQIDQPQTTEQVLEQVLKLDPSHAQAGNDLGYTWADAGKNLDRAEALIRIAVESEPDNPSYLDSLGWVLYKRGQFEQALRLLRQASEPPETADPIVLDHLGDDLYRLNRTKDAIQTWQRSLQRLGQVPEREDLKNLRLQLETKIHQAEAAQPATVAPVAQPSSKQQKPEQAKKEE